MTADNSKKTAKPRGKPFPKGVSGNPKGAPKRGESWGEIIKLFGDMTPQEAADRAVEIGRQLKKYGNKLTLKQSVVLRVYAALLFDPQASLLNSFMDRAEGKVVQPVEGNVIMTWSDFVKADEETGTE